MAINYTKVGWDTSKYVNPTNMNQMDNGIKAACDGVDAIGTNYIKAGTNGTQTIEITSGSANETPLIAKSNATASYIGFKDANNAWLGYFGVKSDKKPYFYDTGAKEIALATFTTNTGTGALEYARQYYGLPQNEKFMYMVTIIDSAGNFNTGLFTFSSGSGVGPSRTELWSQGITYSAGNAQGTIAYTGITGSYKITIVRA